ncbi:esterase FE4-like [Diaphorina citri]|uniref:Carboxylic ester hydrolase n=1 Tax=Diaphorina citri TaxID=121845 RepID=A0A3Q0JCQ2_DIACI|nr:esterase FE4-like [Diaphorina citri]XP_026686208.1 esterase FE4-like [Diaphorina citri]XP_026686209.1 esterase FE4-like [Diaphorina citri]XP_026686210.1 esterase FE4-like [Diaphorina citri]XP_026686211.1 esterase FE4-like [Diaphorina citri]
MVLAAFAVASFCAFCGHVLAAETLIIPQGRIRGTVRQSRDSNPYYAFLGIPYALPPVEDLRFKPSSDVKLPVMVFVHGGGFLMGQATSNMYGPEYFMDHNVVLVTIQYRLGVLGFLSFGNAEVPGNLGMKDQVLALQWIQENIEEFGGNPDSVTIFGESAGAASVSYHLVSPLSKGLFHRAILQSGTASCSWASTPAWLARDRAHAFATLVGCPTQPIETVLDCLRQLPTETFVTTLNKFHIWFKNPMITFAPVIESPLSQNNFLPDHPLRLPHADVPIIIGVNNKEGGKFYPGLTGLYFT